MHLTQLIHPKWPFEKCSGWLVTSEFIDSVVWMWNLALWRILIYLFTQYWLMDGCCNVVTCSKLNWEDIKHQNTKLKSINSGRQHKLRHTFFPSARVGWYKKNKIAKNTLWVHSSWIILSNSSLSQSRDVTKLLCFSCCQVDGSCDWNVTSHYYSQ